VALVPIRSLTADIVVEVSIANPREKKPAAFLTPAEGLFQRMATTERLNTWKKYVLTFAINRPDSFQDKIGNFLNQDFPRLWIRVGARQGAQWLWSDWDDHFAVSATLYSAGASVDTGGAILVLETVDLVHELERLQKVQARRGTFQSIVGSIAAEGSFERTAIEPTGPGEVSYIQAYETNYDFLRRIQPAVQNSRGESRYVLFAREGMFHFHTPDWQVKDVKELVYSDQTKNDVSNFVMVDMRHSDQNDGGRGVTFIPFDPLTGFTKVYESIPGREVRFGDVITQFSSKYSRTYTGHVGQNQQREIEAVSQYGYAADRAEFFGVSFTVTNYPFIGVGDIVKCVNRVDKSYNGLWYVVAVNHNLEKSTLKTGVVMRRGTFTSIQASVALSEAGVTDGRKVSISEIESSVRTQPVVGTQKNADGSIVKGVESPR
jgi:hypothetical protein